MTELEKNKQPQKSNKIYRYPNVGWFGGVCAGIAYHFKVQVWVVRLIAFLAIFVFEVPLLVYILCWILIPKKTPPKDYNKICG